MTDIQYTPAAKYYHNNRDKVLEYKKQFYKNKTYRFQSVKKVQIKGLSKLESRKYLKEKITQNELGIIIVTDNGETKELCYDEFLEQYSFKDDINILLDKNYDDSGNKIILYIPKFYTLQKN